MINNIADLPPFEGIIFQNPDTGEFFNVTIPFFGVRGPTSVPASDGSRLVLRDGATILISPAPSQNSGTASFSSGGPRNGDSILKPDISAPGSPIISTLVGSGNQQLSLSGTSMASPHVAGVAALVQQAHPQWKPAQIKAAIVNSGDPTSIAGYATHTAGSGFVNAASAVRTNVIAFADEKLTSMSFGLREFRADFVEARTVNLHNFGNAGATFNVTITIHKVPNIQQHWIRRRFLWVLWATAQVKVTLQIPAATAGNSSAFRDVAGLINFTPASPADNGGIAMRVPYYVVPRVSSNVQAKLNSPVTVSNPSGVINLTNNGSAIPATAEFYTWGLDANYKGSG